MPPPVYVLVGGRSTRFGADKATHTVDGEPWALHVGRRLAESDAEITLVGVLIDAGELAGVRRIEDSPKAQGPLAGVLAALEDRGEGLLTLASCDLVRPEAGWLTPLLAAHADSPAREKTAIEIAAYRAAGRWQPFPSVVDAGWAGRLGQLIGSGVGSLQQALDESRTTALAWSGEEFGPPQANSPEALRRHLRGEGGSIQPAVPLDPSHDQTVP